MPNNFLSVFYQHIIPLENLNVGCRFYGQRLDFRVMDSFRVMAINDAGTFGSLSHYFIVVNLSITFRPHKNIARCIEIFLESKMADIYLHRMDIVFPLSNPLHIF